MLFQSWAFVACFLPVTLLGFFVITRSGRLRVAMLWLTTASLVFYGWSNPWSLLVFMSSLLLNYALGRAILVGKRATRPVAEAWLAFGIAINLLVLGSFKYTNVLLGTMSPDVVSLAVPLGLSFLTFQQIAFLVDTYRGEAGQVHWIEYGFFLSFFPKLSAGPIVRAREFVPQLAAAGFGSFSAAALAEGFTIFTIGLFKKVVVADGLGRLADPVFKAAGVGADLTFWSAWEGTLAYTFQLYFDFSGYTDMAIGLALMFGLRLPVNFYLPYRAGNIREFWRRWHMTFSRFLRDYLYIPLGGSRHGLARTTLNLMLTMMLGGLWHGASGTFLIWGALHGAYLAVNHAWARLGIRLPDRLAWLVTFLSVAFAWAWFRAENLEAGWRLATTLASFGGVVPEGLQDGLWIGALKPMEEYVDLAQVFHVPVFTFSMFGQSIYLMDALLSEPVQATAWLTASLVLIFWLPQLSEITSPDISSPANAFSMARAALTGLLLFLVLMGSISSEPQRFVYFKF